MALHFHLKVCLLQNGKNVISLGLLKNPALMKKDECWRHKDNKINIGGNKERSIILWYSNAASAFTS